MRILDVFHHREKVGTLSEQDGVWTLVYDSKWVSSAGAYDLAPALPRAAVTQADTSERRLVQWYFSNLLPEENQRTGIAGEATVDGYDDFGLLSYFGAETTGALTFRPYSQATPLPGRLDRLSDAGLNARIKNATTTSLGSESHQKMMFVMRALPQPLPKRPFQICFQECKFLR
jgi:serine/threonine-protein kinase HipA